MVSTSNTPDKFDQALERAFASNKPALINVKIGESTFRQGAISI